LMIEFHIRQDHSSAEMRAIANDGIAHVVKMRNLRFIKDDGIFELARIPHYHPVANDDVFTNVTTTPNMTVLANPGWSL